MPKKNRDLNEVPFAQLHQAILNSKNPSQAAERLLVNSQLLARHLGRLTHDDEKLSYDSLKNSAMEVLKMRYGEAYLQPMVAKGVDLNKVNFSRIHDEVVAKESLHLAASNLGVKDETLSRYLGKLTHDDEKLSYDSLKESTKEALIKRYGDAYSKPMVAKEVNLENVTFARIHQAVFTKPNLSSAASALGVVSATLEIHLSKSRYDGVPLSFKFLKESSPEQLQKRYLESYFKPMVTEAVNLQTRIFADIHGVIVGSKNITAAALKLGVVSATLEIYLSKSLCDGVPLSFKFLKESSPEQLQKRYLESYFKPMVTEAVNLQTRTFADIHGVIRSTDNIGEAAKRLGVKSQALAIYLHNLTHNAESLCLSFEYLKDSTPDVLQFRFGDDYWKPMTAPVVDLKSVNFACIHHAIVESDNITAAASNLGVEARALAKHLEKATFKGVDLSFPGLKKLSKETLRALDPEAYSKPLKLNLRKRWERDEDEAGASDSGHKHPDTRHRLFQPSFIGNDLGGPTLFDLDDLITPPSTPTL